jgi:hypothetical protein
MRDTGDIAVSSGKYLHTAFQLQRASARDVIDVGSVAGRQRAVPKARQSFSGILPTAGFAILRFHL